MKKYWKNFIGIRKELKHGKFSKITFRKIMKNFEKIVHFKKNPKYSEINSRKLLKILKKIKQTETLFHFKFLENCPNREKIKIFCNKSFGNF